MFKFTVGRSLQDAITKPHTPILQSIATAILKKQHLLFGEPSTTICIVSSAFGFHHHM
jgi:hypothetical protein